MKKCRGLCQKSEWRKRGCKHVPRAADICLWCAGSAGQALAWIESMYLAASISLPAWPTKDIKKRTQLTCLGCLKK